VSPGLDVIVAPSARSLANGLSSARWRAIDFAIVQKYPIGLVRPEACEREAQMK
jgi:hypothetical protein